MITEEKITEAVYQLYEKAVTILPEDVISSLEDALKNETDELAIINIETILKNIEIAKERAIPICQDTGIPVAFVKLGNVKFENLYEGIEKGVKKATKEVPLRPNIVDPLTRKNTGDNTGASVPLVDIELTNDDFLEITLLPKGFGAENNNRLLMALPGMGKEGIKDFVLETVRNAGGKPCPPIVIGIGIGGTSDSALKNAKKAILGKIGQRNPDKEIAKLEEDILTAVNNLGIGPMGLGGKTTALDVKIKKMDTHTAGLPIGICIQCWAHRHATVRLR